MDWKLIASTFGIVFLAELGDKTQLAALTLSASSQRPAAVFIGASLALVAVSAVGVAVGSGLGAVMPLALIRKLSAVAFVLIGLAILLDWL
ncbi:MAG: TMEM165/GDT1 family protein [Candidatus Binatia bacterium]